METVLESPDIFSEDESFLFPEDSIIIESSLMPNTSIDISDTSTFEKYKRRKKKAFIIESSEEDHSDNEIEPLNESNLEERASPENAQSNPEENVEHSLSNDQSNRKIAGISFLQGNFQNSTFAQQPTVDKSPKPSTSGNYSFRNARPIIPSRSPSPEDLLPVYVNRDEDSDEEVYSFIIPSRSPSPEDLLPVNLLPVYVYREEETPLTIQNMTTFTPELIIQENSHVPLQLVAWENLEAALGSVQPRTFGKQVEKYKRRKKKAFIIESSEEDHSDNEMEPLNESNLEERASPENAQSNPEENVEHSLSNDQSNRKIAGISFLQGNFQNSTFAQQPTVDKSPKPSTSGNYSFRNARPIIPSRSPSPEDLLPVHVNRDEDSDEEVYSFIIPSRSPSPEDLLPVNLLPVYVYREEETPLTIQNMTTFTPELIIQENSHVPLQPVAWENLEAALGSVQPRTFGKRAIETLDHLEQLHGSLKTCPDSNTYATDPEGLKIELMPHQKHAIAWLLWRENQKPSGGILADDMGLGKTLTMISLTLKSSQTTNKENEETDRRSSKYPGGTLVICPASVLYQWEAEIKNRVKMGLITIGLYHGRTRETKAERLAEQSMVITTYALAMGDYNKTGPLYQIKWRRVILDEAHQIRNHESQTSVAVCNLLAKSRWALTGTPILNKELDLYALLKFLRCSPFDDLGVWKRWVVNKGTGGQDPLNTVMSSLILRRTKQQLAENKMLTCMPERTWELVEIDLEKEEMDIYQKILIFSRTLFAQFLHQRAEKNNDAREDLPYNPNGEYYKMHQKLVKLTRVKKIKQHEILTLLLLLRQICCHPSLITNMLQGEDRLEDSDAEGQEQLNLLDQLNKLHINESDDPQLPMDAATGLSAELEIGVGLGEGSRNLLNPSNPIFVETRRSSKIKAIMKVVQDIPSEDKIIVVSEWTKLLHLVSLQFKQDGVQYYQLHGNTPFHKRMEIVENFNKQTHKVKILLLSLTAGGVGLTLNLIGANHLIFSDLHWNPQLEIQAQDRIYRVGQTKPVKIYKLMAVDTIEQRIKQLQEKRLNIAEELATGAKIQQHNKLSLDDLKMLFNM